MQKECNRMLGSSRCESRLGSGRCFYNPGWVAGTPFYCPNMANSRVEEFDRAIGDDGRRKILFVFKPARRTFTCPHKSCDEAILQERANGAAKKFVCVFCGSEFKAAAGKKLVKIEKKRLIPL